jgi:protein-tyrosine sulfotransferase
MTFPPPSPSGPPPMRQGAPWAQAAAGAATQARDARPGRGPVVVLTYAHAGGARLRAALAGRPELACTSGTGVLPLCEQAAVAWRAAEDRPADAALSPLAVTSIRSLVAMMLTTITARAGRPRWCETATVRREVAETFLSLYPDARFVCLHRACDRTIRAALAARPWGLSGPAFAPYTAAYPGSTVAALAAYWAAHAGPLLAFEAAHPQVCGRVHFEDLDADPDATTGGLTAFLGLAGRDELPPVPPASRSASASARPPAEAGGDLPLPVGQLPAPLLAQVNEVHAQLGYPPLA